MRRGLLQPAGWCWLGQHMGSSALSGAAVSLRRPPAQPCSSASWARSGRVKTSRAGDPAEPLCLFCWDHASRTCSCFQDSSVLSAGSLLTKAPIVPGSPSPPLSISWTLLPALVQQLRLHYPQVITPVAMISNKLISLLVLVLPYSHAGVSQWLGTAGSGAF